MTKQKFPREQIHEQSADSDNNESTQLPTEGDGGAEAATVSRRTVVKAGAGALAATVLAACTPEIPNPNQPPTTTKPPETRKGTGTTPPKRETPPENRETQPPPETREEPVEPPPRREPPVSNKTKVYVIKTKDRVAGLTKIMSLAGLDFAKGKNVLIKPNWVSTDPYPAITHNDTLRTVVAELRKAGCKDIVAGESAGLGRTTQVLKGLKTQELCDELKIELMNFDDLKEDQWESFKFDGMYWDGELAVPKILRGEHAVVMLVNCKTHNLGGHYTMSLKLSIGVTPVPRRSALHSSGNIPGWSTDVNAGFKTDLVVMDALSCFVDGGPTRGTEAHPGLLVASTDRVALDAVGVAILKANGATAAPLQKKIFETTQIARAVEINLGVPSADQIELVCDDEETRKQLQDLLDQG